ncbi:hypothetical protein J1605_023129 [Eschrichtius robustus]|uniref:Cadherin domain-containing protein n=1 Tax=Eschrichtius robustus TaxID=9764 RepID=A0AB34H2U0_ESCRO|nr:hypothetical protein J1605_023129 [Eschrichtius robustus]
MQVMASDADDPTYGSSARLVYSVLDGEHHFTVDPKTGVIRTAVPDLDRESQERYEVVIQATDMAGQLGGLSGSTTVTIVVTDVNDNPPRFPQKMYQFSIQESAPIGTAVGRVKAEDSDVGENTDMTYHLREESGSGGHVFKVTTDSDTQEAIIVVQKRLDFESQPVHTVVLEALNKFVDPRFADLGTFRDQAIVRVAVTDVDEPPEFQQPSGLLEVQEDAQVGSLVGVVTARDPDAANRPVRAFAAPDRFAWNVLPLNIPMEGTKKNKWEKEDEEEGEESKQPGGAPSRIISAGKRRTELAGPFWAAAARDMCWTRAFQAWSSRTKAGEEGGTKGFFTRQLKSRRLARACYTGREGPAAIPPDPFPPPPLSPYAIDRDSDLDQIFDIDADTGAIVTGKGLDRETAGWHNITVLAMEAAGEECEPREKEGALGHGVQTSQAVEIHLLYQLSHHPKAHH